MAPYCAIGAFVQHPLGGELAPDPSQWARPRADGISVSANAALLSSRNPSPRTTPYRSPGWQNVPLLAPHGFVVSMQNGLNEEEIAQAIGAERTLGCLVQYGVYYIGPGHIEFGSEHEIYFGELDGQITPRLKTIAEVMSPVMPSTPTDNIWGWKWTKLAFGSLNFAGALLDVPLYQALQRMAFRPTFGAVVTEAVRVAYSLGHSRLPTYGTFRPGPFADGYGAEADDVFETLAVPEVGTIQRFTEDRGRATIFLPCDPVPQPIGRVSATVIPPAELATIVHRGPHTDIDRTYGALAAYVAQHELAIDGPIREYYLVGPSETRDDALWRTEVGWPIFQTRQTRQLRN